MLGTSRQVRLRSTVDSWPSVDDYFPLCLLGVAPTQKKSGRRRDVPWLRPLNEGAGWLVPAAVRPARRFADEITSSGIPVTGRRRSSAPR